MTRHGLHGIPEYWVWLQMKRRCDRPNHPDYPIYGGRGIRYCDKWPDFNQFYADVGPRPSPQHQLDRIDPNGNYEPGNVRWATPIEQANNKCRPTFALAGRRYGKLTVIGLSHIERQPGQTRAYWFCQCDCGGTKVVRGNYLMAGSTKSCGCMLRHVQ
jgi:hypothetical protein